MKKLSFNENLADRVREKLMDLPNIIEKPMFGGLAFLVDGKLCICVSGNELLVRLDPDHVESYAEKNGVRQMINGKTVMKGYFYVEAESLQHKHLDYWIDEALDFNPKAKSSKKISK